VLRLGITYLPVSVQKKEYYEMAWILKTVQTLGEHLLTIIAGSTFP
jgi:hypothetical protein